MAYLVRIIRWLWQLPLFWKILLANSAIVAVGAVVGTVVTVWHVQRFPDDPHYELIALFALAGWTISFVVNRWVLRLALSPLDRIQQVVDRVRRGETSTRVPTLFLSDERFDRLAQTLNQMLDQLESDARRRRELSRRILMAQEEERKRIARELHDEAAQALTSLLVHLRLLAKAHTPEEAQRQVDALRELTAAALEDVRRIALDLRPKILDDLGLPAALQWLVDEFNAADSPQATLALKGLTHRFSSTVELVIYRVVQEALTNARRHAQAQHVWIHIQATRGQIEVVVRDDGRGFDPAEALRDGGLGLSGMRERLASLGGELLIQSSPGQGTRIVGRIPLAELRTPTGADKRVSTRTEIGRLHLGENSQKETDHARSDSYPAGR